MNKKVHAGKSESAASVIGKVLNTPGEEVVLYVPKGAKFAESRNNFLLMRREARVVGKTVSVESVDEDVLELAVTAGLTATNPFLGKRQKAVSDIVSVRDAAVDASPGPELEDEEVEVPVHVKERRPGRFRRRGKSPVPIAPGGPTEKESEGAAGDVPPEEEPQRGRRAFSFSAKRSVWLTGGVIVLGILIYLAIAVLPRVAIALEFEKTDWDFVGSLNVGTSITQSSFANDAVSLRGVRFSEKKNISKTYPATGSDFVERRAKGTITVYNAFSSEPQELVATTRFRTPEGLIYRMDEGVVVPGAEVVDGEIIPSSVDVAVTADGPGERHNIGPVERFRIPGFQGSPKYDAFYGESEAPMAGGFVGERKVPTEDDIANARADILSTLEEAAKSQLFLNLPPGTEVLDGTYAFSVVDENVDDGGSESDTFSITLFGEASVMVFSEEDLIEVFEERVERDAQVDLVPKDYTIDYGEPREIEEGRFSVAVSVDSVWTRPFDAEEFKRRVSGKGEVELKELIFTIPGVQSGEVRFWPFWVDTVPEKTDRIVVDVN